MHNAQSKKKSDEDNEKKAGKFCEYHAQSLRCCLPARKKIHPQNVDVSVSSTTMPSKMSEEKTAMKRSVVGVLASCLAWLSKAAQINLKGKPDPANELTRTIDVPISRRCAATKRPSIEYTTNAAFGYMQPKEKTFKILEKEKSKGHRKPNETGNAQNELFEGQKKNAR